MSQVQHNYKVRNRATAEDMALFLRTHGLRTTVRQQSDAEASWWVIETIDHYPIWREVCDAFLAGRMSGWN